MAGQPVQLPHQWKTAQLKDSYWRHSQKYRDLYALLGKTPNQLNNSCWKMKKKKVSSAYSPAPLAAAQKHSSTNAFPLPHFDFHPCLRQSAKCWIKENITGKTVKWEKGGLSSPYVSYQSDQGATQHTKNYKTSEVWLLTAKWQHVVGSSREQQQEATTPKQGGLLTAVCSSLLTMKSLNTPINKNNKKQDADKFKVACK